MSTALWLLTLGIWLERVISYVRRHHVSARATYEDPFYREAMAEVDEILRHRHA